MTDRELEQIYNEAYKAVYWTAMALLKNEASSATKLAKKNGEKRKDIPHVAYWEG